MSDKVNQADTFLYKYQKYKTLYHQSQWAGAPDRNYYLKAKKYKNALVQAQLKQTGGGLSHHS